GLAGPVAGDEDAPAADAEGGALVYSALAVARPELAVRFLQLDAEQEPVGAPFRAGRDPELLPQPFEVRLLPVAGDRVAVGRGLGDVLRDVADGPVDVFAIGVE